MRLFHINGIALGLIGANINPGRDILTSFKVRKPTKALLQSEDLASRSRMRVAQLLLVPD